jgi:hypothetical protein
MSLHRAADGRYVAYHRPAFGDRRVGRAESWDFLHWSEPKMVLDQDPADPTQVQFYGLGAVAYGGYEIGTLWVYHTEPSDMDFYKMKGHQQPELAYARSGYAWHRAAIGKGWIALGRKGSWEWGNIQPASSPLLLKDEVRFYYVGSRTGHGERHWTGKAARCGIGMASVKPDRFVAVRADRRGSILTRPFWTETPCFWANAAVGRSGELRAEIADLDGRPIKGFALKDCVPVSGDSIRHRLRWRGDPDPSALSNRQIRMRVQARGARIYALASGGEGELAAYWNFRIPHYLAMDAERLRTQ